MAFVIIKARFACLQGLQVCPEQAYEVVAACIVQHNIATTRKERTPCQLLMPPDVVEPVTLDHPTSTIISVLYRQYKESLIAKEKLPFGFSEKP